MLCRPAKLCMNVASGTQEVYSFDVPSHGYVTRAVPLLLWGTGLRRTRPCSPTVGNPDTHLQNTSESRSVLNEAGGRRRRQDVFQPPDWDRARSSRRAFLDTREPFHFFHTTFYERPVRFVLWPDLAALAPPRRGVDHQCMSCDPVCLNVEGCGLQTPEFSRCDRCRPHLPFSSVYMQRPFCLAFQFRHICTGDKKCYMLLVHMYILWI